MNNIDFMNIKIVWPFTPDLFLMSVILSTHPAQGIIKALKPPLPWQGDSLQWSKCVYISINMYNKNFGMLENCTFHGNQIV